MQRERKPPKPSPVIPRHSTKVDFFANIRSTARESVCGGFAAPWFALVLFVPAAYRGTVPHHAPPPLRRTQLERYPVKLSKLFFVALVAASACNRPDGQDDDCTSDTCVGTTDDGTPDTDDVTTTPDIQEVTIIVTSGYQPIPPECVDKMDADSFAACAEANATVEPCEFTLDNGEVTGSTNTEITAKIDLNVDHFVYLGGAGETASIPMVSFDENQSTYALVTDEKHADGMLNLPLHMLTPTVGGGWAVGTPAKLTCGAEDGKTVCRANPTLARYYFPQDRWHCQAETAEEGNISSLGDGTMFTSFNVDSQTMQTHVMSFTIGGNWSGAQGTYETSGDLMVPGFDGFDLMGFASTEELLISANSNMIPPTATRCTAL